MSETWKTPLAAILSIALFGCGEGGENERTASSAGPASEASAPSSLQEGGTAGPLPPPGAGPRFTYAGPVLEDLPPLDEADEPRHESEHDWAIARGTVEWARSQGLEALPVAEVVGILGPTFVGTPYVPGTLEVPGPENLVVNLHGFDCVTLVEHLLVLARMTVHAPESTFADEDAFRERYREKLTRVRYREGVLDGYPSRLHYFSDWIHDGEAKGLVRDVTAELGGVEDDRSIHFMTSNPEAYPRLVEAPDDVERIRRTEERLNELSRLYVPEERISEVEEEIRTGDIIAAVSTEDGLDIAHTGIALRHDGRVHLLHAPLVGDSVEISERPLADRIRGISSQQGIVVARPQ